MSPETAALVCERFLSLPVERVDFNWHGGEPLLCDPAALRSALDAQRRMLAAGHAASTNKIQTNGRHISDEWLDLVRANPIDIGISMDGPPRFHDRYRIVPQGGGRSSHDEVMATVAQLRASNLPFGTLLVVTEDMAESPAEILDYVSELGLSVDFLPCFCTNERGEVIAPTIRPRSLARFLVGFFDQWIRHPDPPVCRMLEDMLAGVLGVRPSTCSFRHSCHEFYSVDTEGRLFTCDMFFGQSGMCFGDLRFAPLEAILVSPRAEEIRMKMSTLPSSCNDCEWLSACGGGCVAHRVGGEVRPTGRYYYCTARKAVFRHVQAFLESEKQLASAAFMALRGEP